MTENETEKGKEWVKETVNRIANEIGMQPVECIWPQSPDDSSRMTHSLEIRDDGNSVVVKFRRRDLDDAPNPANREVRATLEKRLKTKLQCLGPQKGQIGFLRNR